MMVSFGARSLEDLREQVDYYGPDTPLGARAGVHLRVHENEAPVLGDMCTLRAIEQAIYLSEAPVRRCCLRSASQRCASAHRGRSNARERSRPA